MDTPTDQARPTTYITPAPGSEQASEQARQAAMQAAQAALIEQQRQATARQRALENLRTCSAYETPRAIITVLTVLTMFAGVICSAAALTMGQPLLAVAGVASIVSVLLTRWIVFALFDIADLQLNASLERKP